MESLPFVPFYFIRHGETEWNHQRIAMGQMDIPLNEKGIQQAYQAAEILKNESFQTIFSSPLIRAHKTAEIIAEATQKPLVVVEDLKECCWGAHQGQPESPWLSEWAKGANLDGAEHVLDFSQRVLRVLHEILLRPGPNLLVSHGGVYCAIQHALKLNFSEIPNATPLFHRPPLHPNQPWSAYPLGDEHLEPLIA